MSTPAPTTPDQPPRRAAALNRSFTLPSKFAPTRPNGTPEIGATEGLETLYFHPDVKVLKFSTGVGVRSNGANVSAAGSDGRQGTGTIPWASSSEQTVAVGSLEIYRVPGSVSFLRSGSLLHAIMPRSQCWCVDGVSKFAMRVLTDTYYRIELPGQTPEDLQRVEQLKVTFQKVLHYERTACPFARTFTVDLPEEIPTKKRRRRVHGPAKRWKLEKAYSWKPEDGEELPLEDGEEEDGSGSPTDSDEEKPSSQDEDSPTEDVELADEVRELNIHTPPRPTVRDRVRDYSARRSFTAPVQTVIQSTPPSRLRGSIVIGSEEARSRSPSSDVYQAHTESRTFQAIPTDMPPSPPDSSAGFEFVEHTRPHHQTEDMPSIDSQVEPLFPNNPTAGIDLVEGVKQLGYSSGIVGAGAGASDSKTSTDSGPQTPLLRETTMIDAPSNGDQSVGESPFSDLHEPRRVPAPEEMGSTSIAGRDDPDPFAQIQARIQARRSIGGANDPRLGSYSPYNTPSTSIASRRPPLSRHKSHHQQALTAAIVNKACAVFLGPPAHLVKIMLRIAARLANGTFARSLFASPADESARVPGTFDLDGSDIEDLEDSDADVEEDDFGVPLRSPIRLAAKAGAASRSVDGGTLVMNDKMKRRTWEVD